jgi:hypothetical protein
MTEAGGPEQPSELLRSDPPRLGEVELIGRLKPTDSAILYAGRLGAEQVVVALLTNGAETDSFARARFVDALDGAARADGDPVLVWDEDPEIAPWAAVRANDWDDGVKSANTLLAQVTMQASSVEATSATPEFQPHWQGRDEPGRWRVWPLPWPPTLTAASRWTYLASFTLVVAIASIALFIAVKMFEDQPPAPVNPPYPIPTQTPSPPPTPSPTTLPSESPRPTGGPSRTYATNTGNPPFV